MTLALENKVVTEVDTVHPRLDGRLDLGPGKRLAIDLDALVSVHKENLAHAVSYFSSWQLNTRTAKTELT